MQARLKDGSVIKLEKTCGCVDDIHTGPHWLHMDAYAKQNNLKTLNRSQELAEANDIRSQIKAAALLNRFIELELQRLETLKFEMLSRGMEEIIR